MIDPNTLLLAVAASSPAVVALVGLGGISLTARQKRRDRAEDYRRLDEVAERAEKAAALLRAEQAATRREAAEVASKLLERQEHIAEKVADVAETSQTSSVELIKANEETTAAVRETATKTHRQLDGVTAMVDGHMTGLMRSTVVALQGQETMLQVFIDDHERDGENVPDDVRKTLSGVRAQIEQLETTIADRVASTESAIRLTEGARP